MDTFQSVLTGLIFFVLAVIFIYLLWITRKDKRSKQFKESNEQSNVELHDKLNDKIKNLEQILLEWKGKSEATGGQFSQSLEGLKKGVSEVSTIQGVNKEQIGKLLTNISGLNNQMNQSQTDSKNLNGRIETLNNIFINDYRRGKMGETTLNLILESMLGSDANVVNKQYKMKSGGIVDVFLKARKTNIPIDSKFPYANFVKVLKLNIQSPDYLKTLSELKKNVKTHLTDIAKKYISSLDSTEQAVMYIPSQALFEFIYSNKELVELIKFANEKKVWMTGPNTLPVLLRVIDSFVQESSNRDNINHIIALLKTTKKNFEVSQEQWGKFDRRIDGFVEDAKKITRSSKKIIGNFNDILDSAKSIEKDDKTKNKNPDTLTEEVQSDLIN